METTTYTLTYNENNKLTKCDGVVSFTKLDSDEKIWDDYNEKREYSYDANGKLTSVKYDEVHETWSQDPEYNLYTYNTNGKIEKFYNECESASNTIENEGVGTFIYNSDGTVAQTVYEDDWEDEEDGVIEKGTYTETTTFTYDSKKRVISMTYTEVDVNETTGTTEEFTASATVSWEDKTLPKGSLYFLTSNIVDDGYPNCYSGAFVE